MGSAARMTFASRTKYPNHVRSTATSSTDCRYEQDNAAADVADDDYVSGRSKGPIPMAKDQMEVWEGLN